MLRIFLDEDSASRRVAAALRKSGFFIITVDEAGRRGMPDKSQLEFAHQSGLVLMSANVGDFQQLHWEYISSGRSHSGIVLVQQQRYGPGEIARRLSLLAEHPLGEDMTNRLEFLNDWA